MKHILSSCLIATASLIGWTACTQPAQQGAEAETVAAKYQEPYRPQIHFSPEAHWINDPNGMVYYEGEYHLFYQYYPEASHWGPMHWGHAISTDLVHWEHQPIALYPDSLGYIFSGSAVVDWKNTSGFGTAENPPLVAFFTYHNPEIEKAGGVDVESQAIAYSTDKGRTWTKYAENPVIPNTGIRDFRDQKVIWHEASQQWLVPLALGQEIRFYGSPACKHWSYLSNFGEGRGCHDGVWECPDLFPLKVNGSDEEKWVLIVNINPGGPAGGSATQYFVGDFNGKQFTSAQQKTLWADYGRDNYAGVTWSDAPNGRRIFLGWMNNWQYAGEKPCITWSGAMTLPRELGLDKVQDLYLLTSTPSPEIDVLKGESVQFADLKVENSLNLSEKATFAQAPVELSLTFDQSNNTQMSFAARYGVKLKNSKGEYILLGYDNVEKCFYVDRTNAVGEVFSDKFACTHAVPYIVNTPSITWKLLIDVASVELFTADGRIAITDVFYPSEPFNTIEAFTEQGSILIQKGQLTALKSIYE